MAVAFSYLKRQPKQGSECYFANNVSWASHIEGQHADAPRVRIIFTPEMEQDVLAAITQFPIATMTELKRQQPLLALELVLTEGLSNDAIAVIQNLKNTDLLCIAENEPLPDLASPGLLVMDMDSTAIQIECIDELAAAAGVGKEVAEVTERAMQGELDFEQSLRARVAKLKGADTKIIDELCERLPLTPGLVSMISELQSHNWRTVVASGGFTPFVGHLKQMLELDAAYANELVLSNGIFTGEVTGQVVDAQFKANTVVNCASEWNIATSQTIAIGDGANDIPMVQAAAFGVAYHAKPKLAAAADAAISKLTLEVLPYFLQG